MLRYLASLKPGKLVLWCYLIWYLATVSRHFDPSPALWGNSLGISVIIGFALLLSVSSGAGGKADRWQIFRLFLMPFCVSSFSALIKGKGFVLIFPPDVSELLTSAGLCAAFAGFVAVLKRIRPGRAA